MTARTRHILTYHQCQKQKSGKEKPKALNSENQEEENHSENSDLPSTPKPKKSKRKTKAPTTEESEDDYHSSFICEACECRGRKEDTDKGIEWIGCDNVNKCGKWFHYGCLSSDQQIAVNLSLVCESEWMCKECLAEAGRVYLPCTVCMEQTVKNGIDVAICTACGNICHLKCMSKAKQAQYKKALQHGQHWFCNNC